MNDDEQAAARYVNADGTCGACGLTVRACWCGKEAPPRKIQEVERKEQRIQELVDVLERQEIALAQASDDALRLRESIADALNALEEREFRAGGEHAQEVLAHALLRLGGKDA